MIWTSLLTALAVPPNNADGLLDVEGGTLHRMSLSADEELLVGVDRASSTAFVVQIDDWSITKLDPCGVTAVTTSQVNDSTEIYVGCDDGRIALFGLDDGQVVPVQFDEGGDVVYQLLDENQNPVNAAIDAIATDQELDLQVYFLAGTGDPAGEIHLLQPSTGVIDPDGWPQLADGEGIVAAVDDGTTWSLFHGGQDATIVSLQNGTVQISPLPGLVTLFDLVDITNGDGNTLWGTDTTRDAIMLYNPLQAQFTAAQTGFGQPVVIARHAPVDDQFMIVGGDELLVHAMTNNAFGDLSMPVYRDEAPEYLFTDAVAGADYSFVGTSTGQLQVLSARPWIDEMTLDVTEGVPGDRVQVSFRVSEAGANWSLRLNGDRTGTTTPLATGTTSTADEVVTTTVEVTDNWLEGDNRLYALAAGDTNLTGHARATFTIDTPPTAPVLPEGALGFASGGLELSFTAADVADIDQYAVYVSDMAFEPSDYATGGPDAPEDVESPVLVDATQGATVTVELRPLENDVTYYIAVRAIDAGGQESPLSNVISGVPQPVFTAADLAGETGGSSCSTGPTGGLSVVGLALVGLAMRRRRWAGAAAVLFAGTVASSVAHAEDDHGDMSPQVGNFEIRYGPYLQQDDEAITDIFENGHEQLQVEFGPQLTRFFEIDLQFGFYQELGRAESEGGDRSSTRTMLTAYQLGLSGSVRLHVLDEQFIVPYAKLGMDYVPFAQLTDDGEGGKERVGGSKVGHHYALGANLLLDTFAKSRASLLEAQTGINDTYVTFEWRRQNIDARKLPWGPDNPDGFDFSASMFTVGLKLDY
jgi:hypothetical protein